MAENNLNFSAKSDTSDNDKAINSNETIAGSFRFMKQFFENIESSDQKKDILLNHGKEIEAIRLLVNKYDKSGSVKKQVQREENDKESIKTNDKRNERDVLSRASGVIPKKKMVYPSSSDSESDDSEGNRKENKVKKELVCSSEDSDDVYYSDTEDSEREDRRDTRHLARILKKLDMRPVPQFDHFDEESGQDLRSYLLKFECYCKENFKGKSYLWTSELERHLKGQTLRNFKLLRDFDDDYEDVKMKLIRWYRDEREIRKAHAKRKFENAKPVPNESFYTFSSRLEKLYKQAYPKHDIERSSTLIQTFKRGVSKQLRSIINKEIREFGIERKKLTWTRIQRCTRFFDLEMIDGKEKSDYEAENVEEIVINLNNSDSINRSLTYNRPQKERKYFHNNRTFNNVTQTVPKYHQQQNYNTNQNDWKRKANAYQYERNSYNSQYKPPSFQTPPPLSNAMMCNYCKRFGHDYNSCRKRLQLCFLCNQEGHFYRDCVKNRKRSFSTVRNSNTDRHNSNRSNSVDYHNKMPSYRQNLN